jgi:single-strand DNA-binding protein
VQPEVPHAGREDREEVTFVDCAAFGKTADNINTYFKKGKPIFVEGRLKYDSWEDKQGGGKRSRLTVVVENFQFVGDKKDSDAVPAATRGHRREDTRPPRREQPQPTPDADHHSVPDWKEEDVRPDLERRGHPISNAAH